MMDIIKKSIIGRIYEVGGDTFLKDVKLKLIDSGTATIFPILPPKTTTKEDGTFILELNYNSDAKIIPANIKIKITKKGYSDLEIPAMSGNGDFKENLSDIALTPKSKQSQTLVTDSSQIAPATTSNITKSRKDANYFTQKRLHDFIISSKSQLIPIILEFFIAYGIYDVNALLNLSQSELEKFIPEIPCPSKPDLDNIVKQKNALTKQIGSIIKIIDSTTKYVAITDVAVLTTNRVLNILSNIPLPTAIAGVGIPISVILKIGEVIKTLEKITTQLTAITSGILIILVVLQQTLLFILQILALLDTLIQHCYDQYQLTTTSNATTPTEQDKLINATLNNLTNLLNESSELNQSSTKTPDSLNGFFFSTETEITTKTLKRRRAVAKNKSGISLLQGEWSFSSIDQILIDELIFYIQTNNLKAD